MCYSPHPDSVTPAATPSTFKLPALPHQTKLTAKLEAESFPPLLLPYHSETTHLGSVFDLGPLPQALCVTAASKPTSRPLPVAATLGLNGLNFSIIKYMEISYVQAFL